MIKLADTLAPMADFPAVEAKDIAFNDNKSLQEKYDNGELGGGGTSVTVDTAMSSTSTNPVQNKVIKAYVDSKSVDISADSNNAIKTKTDGLFVEDKTDAIKAVDDKVNSISKFQKYVNAGLDYCYLTISSAYSAQKISVDDIIGFDTAKECNNMKYDLSNHTITLSKGKTYKLSCNLCIVYGEMQYELLDITNNVSLRVIRSVVPDSTSVASPVDCKCIYTPETDCQIQVQVRQAKATSSSSTGTTPQYPTVVTDFGYFIAEEIGRAITIDPLEYANSESGIEDTPVGELITKIGATTPAHYLPCNGTVYNITDYPELAQCIKDEFGSINYYGGDGITTFAVPNYNSCDWWSPGLVNGSVPSPYAVYVSSTYDTQYQEELMFDGVIGSDNCWHSKADGSDTDIWVKFDFGKNTCINGLRMAARSTNYLNQLPSTFTIEGSYDDVNYTVIKSYSGLPNPTSTYFREHLFDNSVYYRYYKLNHMTSNAKSNGHDYCSIAELEFAKIESMSYIKYEPTYFMKNTYSADSVYSTDERVIGKWIDGRPLYSCTCPIQSDTSAGMKIYYYTQITNADYVRVDFEGSFLYSESTKETISLFNSWDTTTYGLGLTAFGEETQIRVSMHRPIWYDLPGYITFIYTKTTD